MWVTRNYEQFTRQFFYLNFSLKNRFHNFFYDVFKIVLTLWEKAGFSDQRQKPEVFYKKVVHKNFAIFTGKHLCWSLFLIKLHPFFYRTPPADDCEWGYYLKKTFALANLLFPMHSVISIFTNFIHQRSLTPPLPFLTFFFRSISSEVFLGKGVQQIYRKTPMSKCDFNKVANQLYWNHTLAWVFFCKFAVYFQNTLS